MSDNDNPFSRFTGSNPLMPTPGRVVGPPARTAPQPAGLPPFQLHHARMALANTSQEDMIRKRDTSGNEMNKLAQIANAPENNRADIAAYIGKLTRTGQVKPEEAAMILHALPEDQDGIRQWARTMFNAVMHAGIHAHAAFPRAIFPGPDVAAQSWPPSPSVDELGEDNE